MTNNLLTVEVTSVLAALLVGCFLLPDGAGPAGMAGILRRVRSGVKTAGTGHDGGEERV